MSTILRFLSATALGILLSLPLVASAQTAPQQTAQQPHSVTQLARQQGVRTCLSRIDKTSHALTQGSTSGAVVFPTGSAPDRQMFSNAFEVLGPSQVRYISVDYAPDSERCNFSFESVQFWNTNCQQTAATSFSNAKPVGLMKQQITVLEMSANARVFLMPAGNGCVSITKQVVR